MLVFVQIYIPLLLIPPFFNSNAQTIDYLMCVMFIFSHKEFESAGPFCTVAIDPPQTRDFSFKNVSFSLLTQLSVQHTLHCARMLHPAKIEVLLIFLCVTTQQQIPSLTPPGGSEEFKCSLSVRWILSRPSAFLPLPKACMWGRGKLVTVNWT